ncbi:PREDICTED: uncharacterized protein At2g29880-like [Prunus mume]|uniref:Uncharacterized protein At2g29880-like n=1 Tax=Prunus mume TaxID=102107 RepID=A0ABM0PTM9_PRUMU|nr:PREDICTED: uncharacterized protein At2g29880-like [Prunus mume]
MVLHFKGVEVAVLQDKVHKGEVKTKDDGENVVGSVATKKVPFSKDFHKPWLAPSTMSWLPKLIKKRYSVYQSLRKINAPIDNPTTGNVWEMMWKYERTAAKKNSIGLGDDTDARTYEVGESRPTRLQDTNEAFVPSQNETSYQSLSFGNFTSSPFLDTNLEALLEKLPQRKKPKTDLMEKREKEREKTNNVWDAIKETPNLDNRARYKALGLVHKLGMKNAFLKMLPEERLEWILYNKE